MSDPVVTLRLNADNSKLLPPVRQSDEAVKRLGATAETTGRQSQQGAAGVTRLGAAADDAGKRANAMAQALNVAKAAAVGYSAVQIASGVTRMADSYANMTGRLKLAAAGETELAASRAAGYDISQRTSTQMESTVALYTRLAQSTAEYGYSQQRQLALTESINRTFAISGASTVAAANTITQFTQALAGGTLRAEEFNSVVENSPRLAQALADGMGIGMGELRKQVNDGKVSVEAMMKALEAQSGVIEAEFNQLPLTVERSLVQLRNAVTQAVGQMSEDLGAGSALANGIAFIANHMDLLEKTITVVAVAYSSKLAVAIAQDITARVQSIAAARAQAAAELVVARTAEAHAVARVNLARAGISSAGGLAAAEAGLQAAQARTLALTQASSVALTAKAAAMRGLNTAMAAFGGPVGLAITALTLFVMWTQNSKAKADELSKSVTTGFQAAIEKLEGFNRETANTSFASLSASIETLGEARKDLDNASQSYRELIQTREVWLSRGGAVPAGFNEDLQEASERMQSARLRVDQLAKGYDSAISVAANLVLEQAGLASLNEQQRASLERLIERQSKQGQTLQQNIPMLQDWAREQGLVEAANKLASASFDQVGASATVAGQQIKAALQEVDKGLDKQINTLQLQLIEKTQGKAAAMRAGFIKEMADKGLDPTSAEYLQRRSRNEEAIALTLEIERVEKANKSATQAQTAATRAGEQARRAQEQQIESQARYAAQAVEAAEVLNGPVAEAEGKRARRIIELRRELDKNKISEADYATLVTAATYEMAQSMEELQRAQAAPQALLAGMQAEVQVLGTVGVARERYQRQLRAEQDMRQAINDANEAGAGINAENTKSLIEQARAYADLSLAVDQQMEKASEWADVATRGIADVADLLSDSLSGGLDRSASFFDELKDVFQRGWRDVLRTFLEQSFVRPIQTSLQNLISGALSGASTNSTGGWMGQLAGLFGGGRGMTGTGAMAAQSTWGAAMAAGAGSSMGFGNNVGSLAGIAGASTSAGGSAGIGDMVQIGGMLYKAIPASGISGGMIAGASYASGALGALYGWNKGGDTAGKGLGAAAYGVAGYYGATAVGTVAAGYAAAGTAGAAAAGSAALAAIPVAGWVALAAIVVDKISGGKLFGTKYQTKETGQTINIDEAGGSVSAYAYQEGQKSLFRGKKRRTIDIDASAESKEAANELYALIQQTAKSAADALGLASVEMISGSFKAVYDKKGNLTSELATVLGRTYSESFELFQQRLQAENIIAQVGQLDDTASQIANRWRSSAEKLLDGSQFLLAAAADFNSGAGLLTVGGLSRLTDLIEKLREGEETLTQAYQRVMQNAQSYASTAAGAYQDVATAGFSNFAKSLLQVKQEEKERISALQAQAKVLSGLSAREVDLAKMREAAQLKTDALVTGLQGELVDLALNRLNDQISQLGGSADGAGTKITDFINSLRMSDTLSPDTDVAKRGTAANLMESAALAGNVDSFIDYAQQMLEVSRRLNASGAGYQADYDRVMSMAKQFGGAGSLQELYAQREALVAQQESAARLERAQRIAQGVSDLAGVKGGDPLDILRTVTGMSAEALAGDLGLSVTELSKYLENQQTDIGDLADILLELPQRIASEMVILLANKEVPVTTPAGATTGTGPTNGAGGGTPAGSAANAEVLQELRTLNARIERNSSLMETHLVLK